MIYIFLSVLSLSITALILQYQHYKHEKAKLNHINLTKAENLYLERIKEIEKELKEINNLKTKISSISLKIGLNLPQ